jgi:plasmid stabilization system protein ParE
LHSISVSDEARADIEGITAYTKANWGWRQADKYLSQLEEAFDRLAEYP